MRIAGNTAERDLSCGNHIAAGKRDSDEAGLRLMRLLFVTSNRIGDAVLSTGLLTHFRQRYPEAKIWVACGEPAAPLFQAIPGVERVIALKKKPLAGHWFELWSVSVCHYWDLVVDLRRSALGYLLATSERLRPALIEGHDMHQVERLGQLVGRASDPPAPALTVAPPLAVRAAEILPDGPQLLVLGPTANWTGKIWFPDRFVSLAKQLVGPEGPMSGARVAVIGGAAEKHLAEPVLDGLGEAIDLVGIGDTALAAALLARARLYIGNDSGLMHIAAAVGTPTLGLFGPSPSTRYRPWGAHCGMVETEIPYAELVGDPDFDHRTTGSLMESLSVPAVVRAASDLLARTEPGR